MILKIIPHFAWICGLTITLETGQNVKSPDFFF